MKDEAFLKDVDAVSDLKLRLGWGKTGQQDTGKEYYTAIYKVSTSENHRYPVGPNNPGTLYQPLPYNDINKCICKKKCYSSHLRQ